MTNSKALAAFGGGGAGLMSRENIASFLNSAAMSIPTTAGGKQFLKLDDKDGTWLYGQEETVVEVKSRWAINPLSMFHGYIAWHEAKVEGEHRQPINRPLIGTHELTPVKAQKGWETQYGFDLVCTEGEDEGTLLEYKTSSHGGKKAFGDLVTAMNVQGAVDLDLLVPIVELTSDSYPNKKWKRDVWNPVFKIVEWASLSNGAVTQADEADDAKDEGDKPEDDGEEARLAAEYAAEQKKAAAEGDAAPRRRLRR